MRLALAQVDAALGDVAGNAAAAGATIAHAAERGAELVVFPELTLHGYTLGDVREDCSIPRTDPRLLALARHGADVVVGFHEDGGVRRYNSAGYFPAEDPAAGSHVHRKLFLPTYLSWEERKLSSPGQSMAAYDTRHGRMATLICADAWQPVLPWLAVQDGAELLLIPANSAVGPDNPLCDVTEYWNELLRVLARMQQCWVVFVNRVGTEGAYRFWGGSRVVDPSGEVVAAAGEFGPEVLVLDVDVPAARRRRRRLPLVSEARLGLVAREVARLIAEGGDA